MRIITFQTETDEARWNDCTFASGAMAAEFWWDKTIDYEQLRILSGKPPNHTGADHTDLLRAYERANLPGTGLISSPFKTRVPTNALRDHLTDWGGACVAVHYGQLPNWYTRWDRAFAARNGAHQIFIYGLDEHGMTFLMDPLGRGRYFGEPIPYTAIDKALFKWNGYVYALMGEGQSVQTYIANDSVKITKQIEVKPLVHLHEHPSEFSPYVAAKATGQKVDYIGYAVGDSGWIAIAMPHGTNVKVTRWVRKQDTK